MDREYARPLDVPAMPRAALMSPSHFSRQFRAAYGETPYGYLMTRRIERAKALLRRGGLSVTEVCMTVGCSSLGSFSARFRDRRRDPERLPGPRPSTRGTHPRLFSAGLDEAEQERRSLSPLGPLALPS